MRTRETPLEMVLSVRLAGGSHVVGTMRRYQGGCALERVNLLIFYMMSPYGIISCRTIHYERRSSYREAPKLS